MNDFLQELKRRRVVRVALVYGAVAFVLLQLADILAPALHLPGWSLTLVVLLLALGLPVALVLAWAFELTPDGVRRTAAAPAVGAATPALVGRRTLLTTAALVTGALIVGWTVGSGGRAEPGPAITTAPRLDTHKIAVLPFRNATPGDPQSETLALGVHDDLLTRLSRVRALRVVSRTSVMEYADSRKSIRDIALELGAGAILEGGVQRAGSQVRINVQLIDAASDEHLWAETYDRPWSLENLFAIQTEIAERVARSLEAALSPAERASLADRPTLDEGAYHLYVQARDLVYGTRQGTEGGSRAAVELAGNAVARDSAFAEAWALLSLAHAGMYWFRIDESADRLAQARRAVDRALALAPELPEALAALGWYRYWAELDYDGAVRAFEAAVRRDPSAADPLMGIASVRRRQGRMDEALDYFLRGQALDPRNASHISNIAETLVLMRRYAEADSAYDRMHELDPLDVASYAAHAWLHLRWRGDASAASRVLDRAGRLGLGLPVLAVHLDLMARDPAAALRRLAGADSILHLDQFRLVPADLLRARALSLLGDTAAARAAHETAAALLERVLERNPKHDRAWSALGLAYAGLGRKSDAIRAGLRGAELLPLAVDAWRGAHRLEELARIYAATGEPDRALDILEVLLQRDTELNAPLLRLDPAWDPLRATPRFRQLAGV
jgi:TolB-like protein/Tfp pilus assembly protein PilF